MPPRQGAGFGHDGWGGEGCGGSTKAEDVCCASQAFLSCGQMKTGGCSATELLGAQTPLAAKGDELAGKAANA
jgi:hypothetical protein